LHVKSSFTGLAREEQLHDAAPVSISNLGNLGSLARARVVFGRPLLRRVFGSPRIIRRLAKRQGNPGLDAGIAAMLALNDLLRLPASWELSPEHARAAMLESIALIDSAETREVFVNNRTIPGPAGEIRVRLYVPASLGSPSPGLVFLHGGGWVLGDLDSHDGLCRKFAAEAALRVVAVDYRLAPEHRFPAAAKDSVAAFRWVAANAEALGIDPAKIGVAGDSAGGNLSAAVALETREDARRPALAALLYPSLDATCSSPSHTELGEGFYLTRRTIEWFIEQYVGKDAARRREPDASPLLAASVAGAPPTLIVAAAFDPLRGEAMAYAARLRDAGVPTVSRCEPGLIHGFAMMGQLSPAAREATERFVREVGRALREGSLA
jgi:acetyl esterase